MRKSILGLLVLGFFCGRAVQAQNKLFAVYDDNQRLDLHAVQDPEIRKLANSTLAVFKLKDLHLQGSVYNFDKTPMEKNLKLCPEQEFAQQPSAADCSAVLVGDDKIFTAGHCVHRKSCSKIAFAFGYSNVAKALSPDSIPADEVYFCKEILSRSNTDNLDYAVVQLDRIVRGHVPVKIARERIAVGQKVFLLSHPGGVPLKYSPPSPVMTSTQNHFSAGISALGGSSGAGVFSEDTHELVGILVSGEDDYIPDLAHKCRRVNVCRHGKCSGEESTHVDVIPQD